ncbi:MAG: CDP-glucose 4,6-dehydratase, partial [Rubrobacteridae bacterium]|nr:CDP-glucose 4,6-dehydratase [Rubrobacteridae bacterium]
MTDAGLFNGVFKGKRVLVTGHTGFKGAWISIWLHSLGASVTGFALEPPSRPSLFEALGLNEKINHVTGDVGCFENLREVFDREKPEVVFHLAAQAIVRRSYIEPRQTFETNVMGTVNLLEAIRNCSSVRAAVVITSDKCYENKEWEFAYRESDRIGGFDPYSSSKGCAELVTSAYYNSFFKNDARVSLASVRAGNVVGGGDWAEDRIVPDCIRALQNRKSINIRNPQAIRPWQHVLEPLSGYLWLASKMWQDGDSFNGAWNFGPDAHSNITVREVAETIICEWGSGSWEGPKEIGTQPHEAKFLKLDFTKANNLLDWYPVYDVEQALRATTLWYRSYYKNPSGALRRTVDDIEIYFEEARR